MDDEDYERVSAYNWTYLHGYAQCGKGDRKLMHRFILNATPGQRVDHVNGNGLDNRRSNLRFATVRQNAWNCRPKKNKRGRYKGVMWEADRKKWVARIYVGGVYKNLGRFSREVEAAHAYDEAAQEYFGDYARCNVR